MIIGGAKMKLMQGIGKVENQMQKEKQTQKVEKQEKVENETRDNQKAVGKPQKSGKQPGSKKNTSMRKKAENEPDKISKKQVFSFRAILSDIVTWKAYAIATGQTIESIGNNAMHEYLKRHRLSDTEQVIFEALKARDGSGQ